MSQQHTERVIGTFEGETPGPLIIVIAALHGNEPAGVRALEMVFDALEHERRDKPNFQFRGKLVGLIGNLQAFLTRQRFVERDLNRMWTADLMAEIKGTKPEDLAAENREAQHLFECINAENQSSTSETTVFLDLHTTSAEGGIFTIPTDEGESLLLAKHLGAPVIVGLQASIPGTLLGFATEGGFSLNLQPSTLNAICVAFEAGQHESPHAAIRSAIAIVRCLRAMESISQTDVVDFEKNLTLPSLTSIPPVVRFRYAHNIKEADEFKMRPGYANFQPIVQGEHLADDVHGPVLSPDKGLILMPLYQAKGSDGFFIVQ
ncbi:MAG: succinylglutamate desuccinylase/aspartoacylase family protein [Phycisphaerae bacterium]|nr:succinylglutamate desuccinylase/aspartoacylase family protein [Saprospiraceae bacterium]